VKANGEMYSSKRQEVLAVGPPYRCMERQSMNKDVKHGNVNDKEEDIIHVSE
jgi:hypothetical protein